jgi:glycosyltransferase involved in cell wall biosynthesis
MKGEAMNIAINAMPSSGYGGVTYLLNMLPALDERDDGHAWFVYGRPATLEKVRFPARNVKFREVPTRGGIAGRLLSEQLRLPALMRSDRIDLVYTANNTDLFFAPRPRVIAIRYTEPFVYRDFFNSRAKQLRCQALKLLTRISLRTSDHVVCVSDYARRIAMGDSASRLSKATVIHHGLGELFSPSLSRPDWAPKEYLFTAAKMIGYSNLLILMEAYGKCRDRGLEQPLFIAGGPHDAGYERALRRRIEQLNLADHVVFLGYLDQGSMAAGMANARIFIFSSLLEACPNTLLEALGCGAAIVASETEPNREVAGEAVAWCDGRDAGGMANAILRVARDDAYRGTLKAKAWEQAAQYPWEKTAESLVRVLEQTYGDSRRRGGAVTPEQVAAPVSDLPRHAIER